MMSLSVKVTPSAWIETGPAGHTSTRTQTLIPKAVCFLTHYYRSRSSWNSQTENIFVKAAIWSHDFVKTYHVDVGVWVWIQLRADDVWPFAAVNLIVKFELRITVKFLHGWRKIKIHQIYNSTLKTGVLNQQFSGLVPPNLLFWLSPS